MKTDIIIKSFNRPFYLHRCLISIISNVNNYHHIYVLDDGTPEKYLKKIQEMFPQIIIKKSENAKEKSTKIFNNQMVDGYKIPSELWKLTVENASEYVVVIEDDVWFTNSIDLDAVTEEMNILNVHLVKLGWQGNTKYLYNFKETKISENLISQFSNRIFLANENLMNLVLNNKYYLFSIFCRLGIMNNKTVKEYYNYLSIPMGLYRKDFWMYTWKDSKGKAREIDLVKNAVSWVNKNKKNQNLIARLSNESLKTTYISSATGSYRNHKANFDVLKFNKILNEKWYDSLLDPLDNYPLDIRQEYLSSFLNEYSQHSSLSPESYLEWCTEFKNQFRRSGAQVD